MKHPRHYYLRRLKKVNHDSGFTWGRSTGKSITTYFLRRWINRTMHGIDLKVSAKIDRAIIAAKLRRTKQQLFDSTRNSNGT